MRKGMLRKAVVCLLVVSVFATGCYWMAGRFLKMDEEEYRVVADKNIMVPMRDNVRLATDIYRPKELSGELPVIMTRLPYNKDNMASVGKLFARRGYIFVIQDCRACYASEGEVFVPILYERRDGMDMVKWISEQPWFNGNLGTWGASYLGITQWAIMDDNPYLKCTYPQITSGKMNLTVFSGGAFFYRLATGWSGSVGKQNTAAEKEAGAIAGVDEGEDTGGEVMDMLEFIMPGQDEDQAPQVEGGLFNLPLQPEVDMDWKDVANHDIDELAVKLGFADESGETDPAAVSKMIELLNYPAFAYNSPAFNFKDRYKDVQAPAFMVSGWFDMFLKGQLRDFQNLRQMAPGEAGRSTRLIIGPWGHVMGTHPEAGRDAQLNDMIKLLMKEDWYDRWLMGEQNGIEDGPPLRIYVMGANKWRNEEQWPLPETRYTRFYIHSDGHANTRDGDGGLDRLKPGSEPADTYTYDPMDPVPTTGGNNLLESVGAKRQKKVESRRDVLVFTSSVLDEPLEVTGPIKAYIFAASSAVDTDFTVKLCDVYPSGKSLNIADGIIRARYRESLTDPTLIEPGKVYKYEVDLWATSMLFRKGHRIRVQVSSSNFPRFDRNSNAGGKGGPENYAVAEQTVYHDSEHPSHILLPVIPR